MSRECERFVLKTGKLTRELSYCVTSLVPERADAAALEALWRGHWTIENGIICGMYRLAKMCVSGGTDVRGMSCRHTFLRTRRYTTNCETDRRAGFVRKCGKRWSKPAHPNNYNCSSNLGETTKLPETLLTKYLSIIARLGVSPCYWQAFSLLEGLNPYFG